MALAASGSRLLDAHFFFVDVVGLSDPEMTTKIQIKKLDFLNTAIASCDTFKSVPTDTMLILPTGDGMAIGFLQGPELPLQLAIELHKKIGGYNKGKITAESMEVRIGIHKGPVFVVNDIRGNRNIWGPGIILARRIMDVGDDGHILLSARVAEDLRTLSDYYKEVIHPLDFVTLKHGIKIKIHSAYGKGFGNPKLPTKIKKRVDELLYPYIEVRMTIKDPKTNLVHYKRMYEIQSVSNEMTKTVNHQIATDVEKTFEDLKIMVYDENGKDLAISSIEVDKPQQKEFYTSFPRALAKGEKRRYYMEYEVEEPERYFENVFLTNCQKFVVVVDYPDHPAIKTPVVYEVNNETDEKKRSKVKPSITAKNHRNIAIWAKRNIHQGQSFRFEW